MRKLTRRWTPHDFSPTNKARWIKNTRTLLEALRGDSDRMLFILWPATRASAAIVVNRPEFLHTSEVKRSQEHHRRWA
jgi:hypothetical protein